MLASLIIPYFGSTMVMAWSEYSRRAVEKAARSRLNKEGCNLGWIV